MPHTFCNSNIQAPTPQRLRHPTGPNSLLEGRRTGEKPATNSVGCNAIDEDFEPAFFASQKVCGIGQFCPQPAFRRLFGLGKNSRARLRSERRLWESGLRGIRERFYETVYCYRVAVAFSGLDCHIRLIPTDCCT